MPLPIIRLQPQRHKRVQGGHPWIYSNAIVTEDATAKTAVPGALVEFRTHDEKFIGRGSFNAKTLIAGRIFTREATENIEATFCAHAWLMRWPCAKNSWPNHITASYMPKPTACPG